jgi:hypothetical protein
LRELVYPNGQSRIQTTRVLVVLSVATTFKIVCGVERSKIPHTIRLN